MSENTKNQSKNQEHNKMASKVDDMKTKDEKSAKHTEKKQSAAAEQKKNK